MLQNDLLEKELREQKQGERATPDILFNDSVVVTIDGKRVTWIDVKHKIVLPGVSRVDEVQRSVNQAKKYTERYGRGIIVYVRVLGHNK